MREEFNPGKFRVDNKEDLLPDDALMLFVDDVDGGCLVECENCQKQFMDNLLKCPGCGKNAVYPGWASW